MTDSLRLTCIDGDGKERNVYIYENEVLNIDSFGDSFYPECGLIYIDVSSVSVSFVEKKLESLIEKLDKTVPFIVQIKTDPNGKSREFLKKTSKEFRKILNKSFDFLKKYKKRTLPNCVLKELTEKEGVIVLRKLIKF